jgi:E3 ubiquitin-protein ligase BRE1
MLTPSDTLQLVSLPDEAIAESTPFKLLQSYVQNLTSDNDAKKSELERVRKEADALREQQETFRQGTVVSLLARYGARL